MNRGQWQASTAYKAFKTPYATLKDKSKLFCEMVKWGEIAALISGITTVQGTAPNQTCFKGLVRNIENQNELGLGASHVRTNILDIRSWKSTIDWTKTKSFVVHLSEGIDETSRKEFDILKAKDLLRAETAIIHGTAFGDAEFKGIDETDLVAPIEPGALRKDDEHPARPTEWGRGVARGGLERQRERHHLRRAPRGAAGERGAMEWRDSGGRLGADDHRSPGASARRGPPDW
jgi:hypothetical protein